jgi:hypothetical protein
MRANSRAALRCVVWDVASALWVSLCDGLVTYHLCAKDARARRTVRAHRCRFEPCLTRTGGGPNQPRPIAAPRDLSFSPPLEVPGLLDWQVCEYATTVGYLHSIERSRKNGKSQSCPQHGDGKSPSPGT